MGFYLAPDNTSTIEDIVAAIIQKHQGAALLVVCNFNTDLEASEVRARDKEIMVDMDATGLKDMISRLLPRQRPWLKDFRMWCILCRGQELCSQTDYILVTDRCLLHNVSV